MFSLDRLHITTEVLSSIAGIDEFKGAWRALGTLAPERLRALRYVQRLRASVPLLGSKAAGCLTGRSNGCCRISKSDHSPATTSKRSQVTPKSWETVFRAWEDLPFSENYIKQFHRDLLRHSGRDTRHCGEYKKLPNSVAAIDEQGRQIGIVFETATPFDTPN